jgi:hypothetical protein
VARDRNRTADTRIFSPAIVAGLSVTIGNVFKRFTALRVGRCYQFEHIVPIGSGKVLKT